MLSAFPSPLHFPASYHVSEAFSRSCREFVEGFYWPRKAKSASASLTLPCVRNPGGGHRLPLKIGTASGPPAQCDLSDNWARTACVPGRGHGCSRWNSRVTARDRCSLAEARFWRGDAVDDQCAADGPSNHTRRVAVIDRARWSR